MEFFSKRKKPKQFSPCYLCSAPVPSPFPPSKSLLFVLSTMSSPTPNMGSVSVEETFSLYLQTMEGDNNTREVSRTKQTISMIFFFNFFSSCVSYFSPSAKSSAISSRRPRSASPHYRRSTSREESRRVSDETTSLALQEYLGPTTSYFFFS